MKQYSPRMVYLKRNALSINLSELCLLTQGKCVGKGKNIVEIISSVTSHALYRIHSERQRKQ